MRHRSFGSLAFLTLLLAGAVGVLVNACAGTGPEALPEDESAIEVVGPPAVPPPAAAPTGDADVAGAAASTPAAVQPSVAPRPHLDPTAPPRYVPLRLSGLNGGEIGFLVPGDVENTVAMLLDFDAATGRRPWAERYRVLSRDGDRVVAEWRFKGKMGVAPTVQIAFTVDPQDDRVRIRYQVVDSAFGLKSFFGDYVVEPVQADPPVSRIVERVFIDSGLPFVNASAEDVENGLREDARRLQAWAHERR
jgi:hypothetical protein